MSCAGNTDDPSTRRNRRVSLMMTVATVIVVSLWLAALRGTNLTQGESDVDSYYHVMMADLGPSAWGAKSFPAATMSVWENSFCDKELMFHAALFAIRSWQSILPFPMSPPFHFPVFCLNVLLLAIFAFVARRFRIAHIPLLLLMLMSLCPSFTDRMQMVRPHIMAVSLTLACCLLLDRVREYRHLWRPFLFSLIFASAYAPPFFAVLPALAFSVTWLGRNWRMSLLLPAATVMGLLAGYVLHPQFPNTLVMLKVTCVDIVRQVLGGGSPVGMGMELLAPAREWLFRNAAIFVLTAANAAFTGILIMKRGLRSMDRTTLAMVLLNLLTITGTLFGRRLIEYAWPLGVLALGLLLRDRPAPAVPERNHAAVSHQRGNALVILLAVAAICGTVATTVRLATPRALEFKPADDFARWAETRLLPGTVIANVLWSDFPMLFYSAPKYRYLVGLDPMYAYHRFPERMTTLEAFRMGEITVSAHDLSAVVRAKYAFVSIVGWQLAQSMLTDGYAPVYQGPDGWLFDLEPQYRVAPSTRGP